MIEILSTDDIRAEVERLDGDGVAVTSRFNSPADWMVVRILNEDGTRIELALSYSDITMTLQQFSDAYIAPAVRAMNGEAEPEVGAESRAKYKTMLEFMKKERIFSVSRTDDGFKITEECDYAYYVALSANQLRKLGEELIAMANS